MPTTTTADPTVGQNKLFMSYAATGEDDGGKRIHHFLSKGHHCLLRTLANFWQSFSRIRFHPMPDRLKPTANAGNPNLLLRPTPPRLSPFSSLIKSVSPSSVARWDFVVASLRFRRREGGWEGPSFAWHWRHFPENGQNTEGDESAEGCLLLARKHERRKIQCGHQTHF